MSTDRPSGGWTLSGGDPRLRRIVENTPNVAVQAYDVEGRVLYWNPAAETVFGWSAAEALGKTLDQLMLDEAACREFVAMLETIDRTGEPAGPIEWDFRRRDGTTGSVLSTVFALEADDGTKEFICMDVDVSIRRATEIERRRIEAQAVQAQRLESLGVLAGGIAHDFNNILTSILGNAELLAKEAGPGSSLGARIEAITVSAKRAADLTRQMLAYAGAGRRGFEPIDLSLLIEEVSRLLGTVVSKKVELKLTLAPGLPPCVGNAGQVRQVLMSLVSNASDALGEKPGTITVRTYEGVVPSEGSAGAENRWIVLEVADTGCGMDEATLARIFEPFFTTKFLGRGLGLAVVHGIMVAHGGCVGVTSEPGCGSTARAWFPIASSKRPSADDASTPRSGATAPGVVLVVDDEAAVREVTARMLALAGHEVLIATDGEDALRVFRDEANRIGAVVLDLTMPKLGGDEVLREVRVTHPSLPVVLTSGYDEQEGLARAYEDRCVVFLQKPYDAERLSSALRQAHARSLESTGPTD